MRLAFAIVALFALAACDPKASPAAADNHIGDTIRAQEDAMRAALVAKDAAAIAALYAPDAQMFTPGDPPHTSAQEIQAAYAALLADPNGSLMPATSDVIIPSSGDYAISQGTFDISFTDPASHHRVEMSGDYITVWRKQDDGSWKIIRDIATPTADAPATEPSTGAPH